MPIEWIILGSQTHNITLSTRRKEPTSEKKKSTPERKMNINFSVKGNKIIATYRDLNTGDIHVASATCNPEDTFELSKGMTIAMGRLLEKI